MIHVITGTREGLEIIALLRKAGYPVTASAMTDYGGDPALQAGCSEVFIGLPSRDQVAAFFETKGLRAVIDAGHPFSGELSRIFAEACREKGAHYLRFVREEAEIPPHPLIHPVSSFEEAARKAGQLGDTVFLTTGSNNLDMFLACEELHGKRVVVRVLPHHQVVKRCQDLGLSPRDIVAMQGPFPREVNRAIFKMYRASVVVTKESGKAGGTDTKIGAALSLGIPVVVIKRPLMQGESQARSYDGVLTFVREKVGSRGPA